MRYTYISAHCVQGIAHPVGETDVVLFHDAAKGLRVLLTADAVPHLYLLDRHLVLMSMMLKGMVGAPLPADFPDLLAAETAKIERQRRDAFGSDPVVLVAIDSDVEAQVPPNAREILDFIVCFDAFDKKALKVSLISRVSAVQRPFASVRRNNWNFAKCVTEATS
jgi:hypothetical protein